MIARIKKLLLLGVMALSLSLTANIAVADAHEAAEAEMAQKMTKEEKKAAKKAAKEARKKAKSEKICKRVMDTGSYSGRRRCHTQEEWDKLLGES